MNASRFFDRSNTPRLDDAPRGGTLSEKEIVVLDAPASGQRAAARLDARLEVARGLLLLWHDHWDAAHKVAQRDEGDPDHDHLHAIAHRREGDFGNAGYWVRGAGEHASYALVAARVAPLLAQHPLRDTLLPGGEWEPLAFLKAVDKGRNGPDEALLRAIQAEEIIAYYDWLTK
jgi:hypothetical protein